MHRPMIRFAQLAAMALQSIILGGSTIPSAVLKTPGALDPFIRVRNRMRRQMRRDEKQSNYYRAGLGGARATARYTRQFQRGSLKVANGLDPRFV